MLHSVNIFPRAVALFAGAVLFAPATASAQQELMLGGVPVSGYVAASMNASGQQEGGAWGAAELTSEGDVVRPLSVNTAVRIASVSKLVVAIALHRLADQGRIALDDDAGKHLGWTLRNPAHPDMPITLRQMLRHESSLSDSGGYVFPLGVRLRDQIGPASFSRAAPDTAFDYSNLGYAILGEVIEAVTGERFDVAIRSLVLDPLYIGGCFNWSGCAPEQVEGGAVLYRKSTDYGVTWKPEGPWVPQVDADRPEGGCPVRLPEGAACDLASYVPGTHGGLFSPQGGLRIGVMDLIKLGRALMGKWPGFLSEASLQSLMTPVAVKAGGAGEETDTGLMQYWSRGGLHCFSGMGQPGGDQPLAPKPMAGCGHLGQAYGLFSGLIVDPKAGSIMAYAITGTAIKPPIGARSRFNAAEEAVLGKLADRIAGKPPDM
jgi:CubicO group peptidase (beta-lactamase class C family)